MFLKFAATLLLLFGFSFTSVEAAPTGWYNLSETWRDGTFTGQIYYDASSIYQVTQINGTLIDNLGTKSITTVWDIVNNSTSPGFDATMFFNNANPAGTNSYDTGFFLSLIVSTTGLAVDTSVGAGLFDWSNNAVQYNENQLYNSPLISSSITPQTTVPEPTTIALMGLGFAGMAARRRKPV